LLTLSLGIANAIQPDWPRFFSYSPDIWKYLDKVCDVWGLRKYMTFNTEVIGCYWQQQTGEWLVKLKETDPATGSTVREFEERCHVLLHGTGILNNFKWPNIEGMEKFKGKIIHTARWPNDYQQEEWKNDRVAVIGSGASSIQTVPNMQPHAKHLDVFVRTGMFAGSFHPSFSPPSSPVFLYRGIRVRVRMTSQTFNQTSSLRTNTTLLPVF